MFSVSLCDVHDCHHHAVTGFGVLNTLFSVSIICTDLTTTQSCDASSFHLALLLPLTLHAQRVDITLQLRQIGQDIMML